MSGLIQHFLFIPVYIRYADTYPVLLPILLYLTRRYPVPREIRIIFWLSVASGVINFAGNQIGQRHINNQWLYHIYAVATFVVTSLYFITIFQDAIIRSIILLDLILFIIFSLINILFWQSLKDFNSNGFGVASIMFIIYSIAFYYGQLKNKESLFIEKLPNFWIVTGIFFYYTGNLFLFFIYNHLIDNKLFIFSSFPDGPWIIHQIMFTILMVCFAVGILLCKQKKQIFPL